MELHPMQLLQGKSMRLENKKEKSKKLEYKNKKLVFFFVSLSIDLRQTAASKFTHAGCRKAHSSELRLEMSLQAGIGVAVLK